jgi:hypothetical protein
LSALFISEKAEQVKKTGFKVAKFQGFKVWEVGGPGSPGFG